MGVSAQGASRSRCTRMSTGMSLTVGILYVPAANRLRHLAQMCARLQHVCALAVPAGQQQASRCCCPVSALLQAVHAGPDPLGLLLRGVLRQLQLLLLLQDRAEHSKAAQSSAGSPGPLVKRVPGLIQGCALSPHFSSSRHVRPIPAAKQTCRR